MKKFIYVVVVIVALLFVREWRYAANIQPLDANNTSEIEVYIAPGSSVARIAAVLDESSLIRSQGAFKRFIKKNELTTVLQAGTFLISPSYSVERIASILQNAQAKEIKLTIPEGFTVKDIDDLLAEKKLSTAGEFIACASTCVFEDFPFLPTKPGLQRGGRVEGYVFPDTYFLDTTKFNVEDFTERLLKTFESKVLKPFNEQISTSEYSLHELITMASMVEKETRKNEEHSIVAGILFKRLEEGISLGVDATVRYFTSKDTAALTRTDLDSDSAYNTRRFIGMPPGPIASPGLNTIEATLNPESSPYYYYLHGNDGQIRYARTNDEHNVNKAKYIR